MRHSSIPPGQLEHVSWAFPLNRRIACFGSVRLPKKVAKKVHVDLGRGYGPGGTREADLQSGRKNDSVKMPTPLPRPLDERGRRSMEFARPHRRCGQLLDGGLSMGVGAEAREAEVGERLVRGGP